MKKLNSICIPIPFDGHFHFRQGTLFYWLLLEAARIFCGAVAMGNTNPPIDNPLRVRKYKTQAEELVGSDFQFIQTVMFTLSMTPRKLEKCYQAGARVLKWIPGGASTNSGDGVPLADGFGKKYLPVLKKASELGMILSIHFELVIDPKTGLVIPFLDREHAALYFFWDKLIDCVDIPLVIEHVTTRRLIEKVWEAPNRVYATIAPHHKRLTWEDVFYPDGKTIRNPLAYCLPVAKTSDDRQALIEAALSGSWRFFLGTDSASHPWEQKMAIEPKAGIYIPPEIAISSELEIFEEHGGSDWPEKFIAFACVNGPMCYNLQPSEEILTMVREPWKAPAVFSESRVPVYRAGEEIPWRKVP